MSIKTEITVKHAPLAGYPKLMINEDCGNIWLFARPKEGVLIYRKINMPGSRYQIGDFLLNLSMDSFVDFHGQITLSNEIQVKE